MGAAQGRPRLGERLIEAGMITPGALERALDHQKTRGGRLGECLVGLSLLGEQALLRFLADEHRTRYVSAEKLAHTPIAPDVLDRVPVRMAEQQALIPILHDPEASALSVVMAEPQNVQVLEEVRLVAGVEQVHAYVGLRSAVAAAVRRHYYGDTTAFEHASAPARGHPGPLPHDPAHARAALARTAVDPVELARALVAQLESRRRDLRSHALGVAAATRVLMDELGAGAEEREAARLAAYVHDLGKRADRHLTLMSIAASAEHRADARRMVRAPARLLVRASLPELAVEILANLYEAFDGSGLPARRSGEEIPLGARVIAAADALEDLRYGPANPLGRTLPRDEALAAIGREAGTLFDPAVILVLSRYLSGDLLRERLATPRHPVLWVDPPGDAALLAGLRELGLPVSLASSAARARAVLAAGGADVALCTVDPRRADGLAAAIELRPLLGAVPLVLTGAAADPASIERALRLGAADYAAGVLDAHALATRLLRVLEDRGVPPRPVTGSLDELSLPDLLRNLERGNQSGVLSISWAAGAVEVGFEAGRIVHARAGGIAGERALALLAEVDRADVHFDPASPPPTRDIDRDVESVLARIPGRTS